MTSELDRLNALHQSDAPITKQARAIARHGSAKKARAAEIRARRRELKWWVKHQTRTVLIRTLQGCARPEDYETLAIYERNLAAFEEAVKHDG